VLAHGIGEPKSASPGHALGDGFGDISPFSRSKRQASRNDERYRKQT
jgi:hypothetical protein